MQTEIIDARLLRRMLFGAAASVRRDVELINELNVFPVPDGDTGTNMLKTLEGGISRLPESDTASAGELSAAFAKGCVLGARGNSGVILSQFISGICGFLKDKEQINLRDALDAAKCGVERAYHAVANPVEGTMLTVFRESVEYTRHYANEDDSFDTALKLAIEQMNVSLQRTMQTLPALIEAQVVDSGGMGALCILRGMYQAMTGDTLDTYLQSYTAPSDTAATPDYDLFTTDSTLEWGYCTECLVRLMRAKGEPADFGKDAFVDALQAAGCNSIVVMHDADVLKVHAHTMTPSAVLDLCQRYGEFLNVKIENMSLQHSEKISAASGEPRKRRGKADGKYAIVTVASGEGMVALFEELGADVVIDGGQTNNPSTEDFINAFSLLDSENIIVLPNNSNVILTAEQAAGIFSEANVVVIPTRTLPQGYCAISVFSEYEDDVDSQVSNMTMAKNEVVSGEITSATRDTTTCGVDVKCGESIGILDGTLVCSAPTDVEAMLQMIGEVEDLDERELLTLFVGEGVSDEQRCLMSEAIEERYGELEVSVKIGNQPTYRYLIAVE